MPDAAPQPQSRRERLRAQALDEIQEHAFALIDADGVQGLSLTAIAKAMGMSGPAMYRYFESREALVAQLVTASYGQLADALDAAAAATARRKPEARLRAVVAAYREWALAHPRRYAMLFGDRPGQVRDTDEALATINRGMEVLVAAVVDLGAPDDAPARAGGPLNQQLGRWADRYGRPDVPTLGLRLAIVIWTRLHGIVGLELAHVFDDMQLDAGLLLDAEIDAALRELA
jgi:AcrR family transcriptional regulator